MVKFDRKDSGKTKAALETSTKAKMVELKAIDFTGLHMIKKYRFRKKKKTSTRAIKTEKEGENMPISLTDDLPLLYIQCIHTNIEKQKSLGDK